MLEPVPTVFVVDNDASAADSVAAVTRRYGLQSVIFASVEEFLAYSPIPAPGCLILNAAGPEWHSGLASQRSELPVILVTDRPDFRAAVRALKSGAMEFLGKPLEASELMDAIYSAIEYSRAQLAGKASLQVLRSRHDQLTKREREVMALVTAGLLNKQIGARLGISEITVKAHRGSVMRKMRVATLVDLVDTARNLGISPSH